MSRLSLALLGLFLALALSACGAVPAASWPGLATEGDLIFVAFNNRVHAVNAADSREVWAYPPASSSNSDTFFAEPAVSGDMLVVGSEGPATSYSGAVFGLDIDTGAAKWCRALNAQALQRVLSAGEACTLIEGGTPFVFLNIKAPKDDRLLGGIAVADGIAYFGLANNRVYALDAATGDFRWSFDQATHPIWATPLVVEGTVYVASLDHNLYALDAATGALRWAKDLGAALGGTPAFADGKLYVGTFGNTLLALDAEDGDILWEFTQATNWIWGGPTLAEGVLYFADLNGNVFAVDAVTGQQRWQVTPGGKMRASPAIVGEALYIGDKDGNIFALDRADGSTLWTKTVEGGGQVLANALVVPGAELVVFAPYQGSNLLVPYTSGGELRPPFAPSR